jgi:hypothetical protein
MIRFAVFAFALLAAAAAQGQVYKCLDASGRTIYSQTPCPPDTKREAMSRGGIPPASAAAPAAAPAEAAGKAAKGEAKSGAPSIADQEQAFRKRQQESAKAAKEAEEKANLAKAKADQCNNAKQRLATYEMGGRISRVDANGERYYMEDSQIEAEKQRARADVSQACN